MNVTPVTGWLRDLLAASRLADERGLGLDDAVAERAEFSRRQFLQGAAALSTGLVASRRLSGPSRWQAAVRRTSARVVIVGAGLAGLRCAQLLHSQYGIAATVYEAADRVGGRCWTLRDFFVDGQVSEHGGGFISSEHAEMRSLAAAFGLRLEAVYGGSEPGLLDTYWLGRIVSQAEVNDAWLASYPAIRRATLEAGALQNYRRHTPSGVRLDHTSVPEWVLSHVAGGTAGPLGQLLLEDVSSEYGGDPGDQSVLNLLSLISGNGSRSLPLSNLAGTDEKYHVAGGNDLVVDGLASRLPGGSIHTGCALVALAANADGTTTCVFQSGASTFEVVADCAVLALPFSTLRAVDLRRAGLSALKLRAIREMGMGTNAKLHVQLASRPWARHGLSGVCYTGPRDFQLVWDETVAQSGASGILLHYPGGTKGASLAGAAHGPAPAGAVASLLKAVEPVFQERSGPIEAWRIATRGRSTRGITAPTHSGESDSSRPSGATRRCRRGTSIFAASTRRSTFRATWREPFAAVTARPTRWPDPSAGGDRNPTVRLACPRDGGVPSTTWPHRPGNVP